MPNDPFSVVPAQLRSVAASIAAQVSDARTQLAQLLDATNRAADAAGAPEAVAAIQGFSARLSYQVAALTDQLAAARTGLNQSAASYERADGDNAARFGHGPR